MVEKTETPKLLSLLKQHNLTLMNSTGETGARMPMRTSPVRNKKGEHRELRPRHTDSVFKEKEERRSRRLQRTGSIINGKGESAKVEVGGTALWNYTAGTGKIREIKKIDFLCPVLRVLFPMGKKHCCCSAKPRPQACVLYIFGHP
jgi:hypothetical protein